jgi:hypothetical protein
MSSPRDKPAERMGPWGRLFCTVVYLLILGVVRFGLWGVLIVQWLAHLLTGKPHRGAELFGESLADYVYRVWLFLVYHTEERPFPFTRRTPKTR